MPDIPYSLAARLMQQVWPELRIAGDKPIGRGTSGVVWRVTDGEDAEAVKIMPFQKLARINRDGAATDARVQLGREWQRIVTQGERLESQWIVGINGWKLVEAEGNTEDEAHAHGLVRMALWPGNLHSHVVRGFGKRTGSATAQLVRAAAAALDGILRDQEYICTDLKPENLLIRERSDGSVHAVVGDIGGLKGLDSLTGSTQTTPKYAAPESLRGDKTDLVATIFSFGLVGYFIIEGRLPFEDENKNLDIPTWRRLLRERGPDFRSGLPAELAPVVATIRRCLSEDRAQRPQTFVEVIEGLSGHEPEDTTDSSEARPTMYGSRGRRAIGKLITQAWSGVEIGELLWTGRSGEIWSVRTASDVEAVRVFPYEARSRIQRGSRVSAASDFAEKCQKFNRTIDQLKSRWFADIREWKAVQVAAGEDVCHAYILVRMELWSYNLSQYVRQGLIAHRESAAASLIKEIAQMQSGLWQDLQCSEPDLCPDNILVRELGDGSYRVVLVNPSLRASGLMRIYDQFSGEHERFYDDVLNEWPFLSAPEVGSGGANPDMLSSIYNFGLTGYFVIEGHLPYKATQIAAQLPRERGPDFRPDLPAELAPVIATIRRCLSEDRAQRPQTFAEVIEGLSAAGQEENPDGASSSTGATKALSEVARGSDVHAEKEVGAATRLGEAARSPRQEAQNAQRNALLAQSRAIGASRKASSLWRRLVDGFEIGEYQCDSYPDGDSYSGQIQMSKLVGFGPGREKALWKRGGFGVYVWADGKRYEGEWRLGARDGYGVLIGVDGSCYEGEWRDDQPHGYGIFRDPNGTCLEGAWRYGEFEMT